MPLNISELRAKELKPALYEMDGISRRTIEEHYKLYQGYVNKHNEIVRKLADADLSAANQTYSDIRELKVELTFALGGVKNHEIYFDHLGGAGGRPEGRLLELIERGFGLFDAWAADLKATGIAARGWVWLALDHDYGYLFNYLGDAQNTFPVWNATPILALDTYEHAYFIDYGVNRSAYIDAFLRNLDWRVVSQRLEKAEKMLRAAD
ncbi:MAG: superoxide dismutase [Armatimonadota bacterium]